MTPHNVCELFRDLWQNEFNEKYFIVKGKDHKWAKELIEAGIDADTIVRRAQVYFKTDFYRNGCRCTFAAFASNINQFSEPTKKQRLKISSGVTCSFCDILVENYDEHLKICQKYSEQKESTGLTTKTFRGGSIRGMTEIINNKDGE